MGRDNFVEGDVVGVMEMCEWLPATAGGNGASGGAFCLQQLPEVIEVAAGGEDTTHADDGYFCGMVRHRVRCVYFC